ncbi:MAG: hypothetical protein MR009_10155 [Sutterellaceae bacterium]|nr:hypothetical protein [Sutterellaceae bacterium]MDD7441313.1 hypothetical protein [Sutterellaceae bacterium]MDY2868278.1 hypothetical protein [Mesosutterella sp.]
MSSGNNNPENLQIEDDMKGSADFPVYGERIPDLLPPEHFLWQLQGSFPGFDEQIAGLYREQHGPGKKPEESWPEDVLIPGDFYLHGIVIPQMKGILPSFGPAAPDREVPGRVEDEPAPEPEKPEENEDEAEDYPEDYGDELPPEWEDEPPQGEDFEQMVSSVQSRIAIAGWEVYKDVVSYPPEVFRAIVAAGAGLRGHIPASLLSPLHTFSVWVSFAGLGFELHGEKCLGAFVFRGENVADGPTLNLGFVTKNSYYDYAIPLTSHASLDYVIESSTEFMAKDPRAQRRIPPEERESLTRDLKNAWARVFPVIVHVAEHFPRDLSVRRRGSPVRAMLKGTPLESPTINLWRWSAEANRFRHDRFPSLLKGSLRSEFLRSFINSENNGPYEIFADPDVPPVLN